MKLIKLTVTRTKSMESESATMQATGKIRISPMLALKAGLKDGDMVDVYKDEEEPDALLIKRGNTYTLSRTSKHGNTSFYFGSEALLKQFDFKENEIKQKELPHSFVKYEKDEYLKLILKEHPNTDRFQKVEERGNGRRR